MNYEKKYNSYITPEGKALTDQSVSYFLPKNGGSAKDAAGKTFNYWQKTYDTHPEEYMTPEEQDEALSEINAYNTANAQLEANKNKEENPDNTKNNTPKVTPVCDDVKK